MAAPHRIAFLSPRFAEGDTVGGAETLLRQLAERTAAAGYSVDFLTTCARNHFTWANELPPGTRPSGPLTVRYFPVDENRDLHAFLQVQNRISNFSTVTREEELLWQRHSVNSSALCKFLETEGLHYDRIVMGSLPVRAHLFCQSDSPGAHPASALSSRREFCTPSNSSRNVS